MYENKKSLGSFQLWQKGCGKSFGGFKYRPSQSMEWPRWHAYNSRDIWKIPSSRIELACTGQYPKLANINAEMQSP